MSSVYEKYFGVGRGRRGASIRVEAQGRLVSPSYFPGVDGIVPHPPHLEEYPGLCNDPQVGTAITVLTGMVFGAGIYTEMPEEEDKIATPPRDAEAPALPVKKTVHPHKQTVDDWAEEVGLDERLGEVYRDRATYGYCPVLKESEGELFPLQPEYVWMHRDERGRKITKYTLRRTETSAAIDTYKPDEVVWFTRFGSLSRPYGVSIAESIRRQVTARDEVLDALPEYSRRAGYPFRIYLSENRAIGDIVYDAITGRESYENAFLDAIPPEGVKVIDQAFDARYNPTQSLEYIDFLITEGLFAPLLMSLKNATEASATKMLEAIERFGEEEQRYFKRRIEHSFFEPLVGKPVPRLMYGSPDPSMKEVSLTDLAMLIKECVGIVMTEDEGRALLRHYVPLKEGPMPVKPKPVMPAIPFGPGQPGQRQPAMNPNIPPDQGGELEASLGVIHAAYEAKQLTVEQALGEGRKVIEAHVERAKHNACKSLNVKSLSPESEKEYRILRNELFDKYRERLVPMLGGVKVPAGRSFRVRIE